MKNFFLFLSFFYLSAHALSPKEKIVQECQKYTDDEIIANKAPSCKKAINAYLQKVIDDKIPRFDQGLYAFLSIALRAEMPLAYKLIEKEIYEGHVNEWTDKLEELNFDLYGKSLIKWARHVESEVRKIYKANQNKKGDYIGTNSYLDQNAPELMNIWSPILMIKYLNFLSLQSQRVEIEDFYSINIIYAFSMPSFREIFTDQISKIVLKASDKWVKSIRTEHPWALFRLFPLISKSSDGNIKRELIWLEQYHQDFKIRALARSTIAKISN